ncbi:MAG: peptidylprolyl isomerase [Muribaculaceae bacterium]
MRNRIFLGAIVAVTFFSWAGNSSDAVLMKINNKDVTKGEFEYLYNKNNQQQIEKQSLDKYLDMFVIYKLKVADAQAAGIDTTTAFIKEFNGYCNELTQPYLEDKSVENRLAMEAYDRMKEDVEVCHLMISLEAGNKNKLDSIRKCIVNGEDWGALVKKYSIDNYTKDKNGDMGFIVAGKLPYTFEYATYNTPKGEISQVVETPFGFHIVKPGARRAAKGTVLVKHIMKLVPRDATPEVANRKKAQMDSIYKLVKAGANFEEIAKKESDDTGSARKGGELPWFGTREMVPEFETVAFALENGAISEPFKTTYGIHIIKKIDSKEIDSFENVKDKIVATFVNDERSSLAKSEKIEALKKQYNLKVNEKTKAYLFSELEKNGQFDSIYTSKIADSKKVIITYGNKKVLVKDIVPKMTGYKITLLGGKTFINSTIESTCNEKIVDYEKSQLALKYPAYRNLVNEYRDGMLLFEISNKKVWDGASKDVDGLEEYFKNNKDKYSWDAPKYKGLIIQVSNDSIARAVKASLKNIGGDTIIKALRSKFKKDIRVEKVLVGKGENKIVDELAFNGTKDTKNADARFPIYFLTNGKIIDQPEEATDVRGQVTADYQTVLEDKWVKELKNKYPVKLNKKVLEKIK